MIQKVLLEHLTPKLVTHNEINIQFAYSNDEYHVIRRISERLQPLVEKSLEDTFNLYMGCLYKTIDILKKYNTFDELPKDNERNGIAVDIILKDVKDFIIKTQIDRHRNLYNLIVMTGFRGTSKAVYEAKVLAYKNPYAKTNNLNPYLISYLNEAKRSLGLD